MVHLRLRTHARDYYICSRWNPVHPGVRKTFRSVNEARDWLTWFRKDSSWNMLHFRRLLGARSCAARLSDWEVTHVLAQWILQRRLQVWAVDLGRTPIPVLPSKKETQAPCDRPAAAPVRKTRKLRFQVCGGEFAGLGIPDVPYVVERGGFEVDRGKTDSNGDVTLELAYGETVDLRVFDTTYAVRIESNRKLPPLPGADTRRWKGSHWRDFGKRFDILGYLTEVFQRAAGGQQLDRENDSTALHQAVLNFLSDHDLRPDGEITADLMTQLNRAIGL